MPQTGIFSAASLAPSPVARHSPGCCCLGTMRAPRAQGPATPYKSAYCSLDAMARVGQYCGLLMPGQEEGFLGMRACCSLLDSLLYAPLHGSGGSGLRLAGAPKHGLFEAAHVIQARRRPGVAHL